MRYIADVLTATRLFVAVPLFVLILLDQWKFAMVLLIIAALSDAFDGMAARRWPPKEHWYRKDPHLFDNAGDSLLFVSVLLGLAIQIRPLWVVLTALVMAGTALIEVLRRNLYAPYAERVDVIHGWFFAIFLVAMLVQITERATEWWPVWTLIYFVISGAIVAVKWDRATSRPEGIYTGTWLKR